MAIFSPDAAKLATKTYSQNNEDGILTSIFSQLEPRRKFFVEFGVGPPWESPLERSGMEANCRLLREQGWDCLFMDGNSYPHKYEVKQNFITAENINSLLSKYDVPSDFSLISIDVDGQDIWIWEALEYRPQVVVIEYNPNIKLTSSNAMPKLEHHRWDGTQWYGAGLRALQNLGRRKGYVLLYTTYGNAFFVLSDCVDNPEDFKIENIYKYREIHKPDRMNRAWVEVM